MYHIGVDIGGTNIAVGLVNEKIEIVRRGSTGFVRDGGPATAQRIREQIERLIAEEGITLSDIESIGVVVPGSIDTLGETVIDAYNLGFHNEPLKQHIASLFPNIPVVLANDANGAALAELRRGALQGCRVAAMLTLGTGVGGGLILGGRMFNGGKNNGVELGHMTLVNGGEPCSCGNRGCIEAYVSATALIREGKRAAVQNADSMLHAAVNGDLSKLDAKTVIDCAKMGDPAATKTFMTYIDHLGSAIVSIINLLDCERIAVGGGVSAAGDFLFDRLRENVKQKSFFEQYADIVPAVMGNDAGIVGAAMLYSDQAAI